ncbi:Chitooligosaccharide deacetylase ChbG [Halioglobus japonicus]|nr:Chitooligosaccharide deacetylase ChbG [Halioglobus japonicus]
MNDAIIDTFEKGGVTSTTLMVNVAATEDAVAKAKRSPGLGVGLHFNITFGRPLSSPDSVATLVDEAGHFHSRGTLARNMLLGRVSKAELERELSAQFEQMRQLGMSPTHIDSHQHLHAFPLCFDVVAAFGVAQRVPIRMPWVLRPKGVRPPVAKRLKHSALNLMLARNSRRWNGLLDWNTGLGSIFDLGNVPQQLEIAHYRLLLEAAPTGIFELMVHPARVAAELGGLTRIGDISEREWRFLMSERLPALMKELGFTSMHYGEL